MHELDKIRAALVGRTIASVDYMDRKSANDSGWDASPVVILLDDGTMIYALRDEEANGPGVIEVFAGTQPFTHHLLIPIRDR